MIEISRNYTINFYFNLYTAEIFLCISSSSSTKVRRWLQLLHDIAHSASQEDWEDREDMQYVKPVSSHIGGTTFQFNYA